MNTIFGWLRQLISFLHGLVFSPRTQTSTSATVFGMTLIPIPSGSHSNRKPRPAVKAPTTGAAKLKSFSRRAPNKWKPGSKRRSFAMTRAS